MMELFNSLRRYGLRPEGVPALRDRINTEVSRFGRRAFMAAGQIVMRLPRLSGTLSLEVKPVEDGWMIAETGSSLPIRIFAKKAEAVKEAKRLSQERNATLTVKTRKASTRGKTLH